MILYTAHYEGLTGAAFFRGLADQGIRLLVDVREAPISRKPGFSKTTLAAALSRHGIEYRHMRALGCPKPIRDAYREDGDWARYTRQFLRHLDRQRPALLELAGLASTQPTALLCFEADFNRCHRTYVARAAAAERKLQVCHITPEGLVTEATSSSGAAGRSR